MPSAGAQIDARAAALCQQVIERLDMSRCEIAHVDIISHCSAVGGLVVGAENIDGRNEPLRGSYHERNDMRFRRMILTDFAVRIGPGCVEIAQVHVLHAVGLLVPVQYLFHEQFRFAVWIYRGLWMMLTDRKLLWIA